MREALLTFEMGKVDILNDSFLGVSDVVNECPGQENGSW